MSYSRETDWYKMDILQKTYKDTVRKHPTPSGLRMGDLPNPTGPLARLVHFNHEFAGDWTWIQIRDRLHSTEEKRAIFQELNTLLHQPDFWHELREDVETLPPDRAINFNRFLNAWDPDLLDLRREVRATYKYRGKYEPYVDAYDITTPSHRDEFGHYLAFSFKPRPSGNEEADQQLAEAIFDTREVIHQKTKNDLEWIRRRYERDLHDPRFWQRFGQRLSQTEMKLWSIEDFLLAEGYNDLSTYLFGRNRDHTFIKADLPLYDLPGKPDKGYKALFALATPDVRLRLSARFPDDFKHNTLTELQEAGVLPTDLEETITRMGLLSRSHQETAFTALGMLMSYEDENLSQFHQVELTAMLMEGASRLKRRQGNPSPTFTGVLADTAILHSKLAFSEQDTEEGKTMKQEVQGALESSYLAPMLKSLLYLDAADLWKELYGKRDHNADATTFVTRFKELAKTRLQDTMTKDEDRDAVALLLERVLPHIATDLQKTAEHYASVLPYLREKDDTGKPISLFLHQAEAVRLLDEGKGILSDEPGLGKTLDLELAALLHIAKLRKSGLKGQARILVVAGKTVIDNWQKEIPKHLVTDDINIVNVNATGEKGRVNARSSLGRRIQRLEAELRQGAKPIQVILTNYDLFRNDEFMAILERYPAHVDIVDEAHNIKSRFAEVMDETRNTVVAQRTHGLYRYLRSGGERRTFIATSTPFVKDLIEPMLLTHLVDPERMPIEDISRYRFDEAFVHAQIQEVMIRRKKEIVMRLPNKEIRFVPIDLSSLDETDQQQFLALANEVYDSENGNKRFYELLALEVQAKFPWMIDTIRGITNEGKKAVITTPYVNPEASTGPISTVAVANRLQKAGLERVSVLDGKVTNQDERVQIQEDFLDPKGNNILIHSSIGGESITLCNEQNRATHVFVLVGPNQISRFLNSIDRIHRIGQTEDVVVHVPFVVGDLLNRLQGTYDQQVIRRLAQELAKFNATIEGDIILEPEDIYQELIQQEKVAVRGSVVFQREVTDIKRPLIPKRTANAEFVTQRERSQRQAAPRANAPSPTWQELPLRERPTGNIFREQAQPQEPTLHGKKDIASRSEPRPHIRKGNEEVVYRHSFQEVLGSRIFAGKDLLDPSTTIPADEFIQAFPDINADLIKELVRNAKLGVIMVEGEMHIDPAMAVGIVSFARNRLATSNMQDTISSIRKLLL